jgi:hypothetical protein
MQKMIPFAALLVACASSLQQIVTEVIDIVDAVCIQAEQQPDPAWVYFVCTVAGAPPGTASQYTMKVPAGDAIDFATKHMGK